MDIEQRLRASLAAREPGPDFEGRVMARLAVGPASSRRRTTWRVPAALAATMCSLAFALHWYSMQQREERARQQLMLALEITSNQLNRVQQKLVHVDPTIQSQENGS